MFKPEYKLDKNEAEDVIINIKAYTSAGLSLVKALEFAKEADPSKRVQKILSSCVNEINKGETEQNVLYHHGIVNEEEKEMLSISDPEGIKASLEKITELRKYKNKFEKIFLSVYTPIFITFIGTISLVMFFREGIVDFFSQVKEMSSLMPEEDMALIDSVVWFIYSPYLLVGVAILVVLVTIVGGYLFVYYSKNDKSKIYGILKIKAIDDMPRLFQVIDNMNQSGESSPLMIMEKLSKFNSFSGFRKMFREIKVAIENNEKVHHVMKEYKIPRVLVILIKSGEESGDFFSVMPDVVTVAKELSNSHFERFKARYQKLGYMFSMLIVIYFILSLFITNMAYTFLGVLEMLETYGNMQRM